MAVDRFRVLRDVGADGGAPPRAPAASGRRRTGRVWFGVPALLLAAVTCVWTCVAIFSARPPGPLTALRPPVTAASVFADGIPSCSSIGAQGLLDDGSAFYVSDWCTGATYEFAAAIGAPAKPLTHALNGLTDGLALDRGVYFGIAGKHQTIVLGGIYTFDPNTLDLAGPIAALPCGDTRGLAADQVSGALYVTGDCGLFRVSNPGSADQQVTELAKGDLDGVTVSADGRELWVAAANRDGIEELSSDGHELAYVPLAHEAVGVVLVPPGAPAPPARASLAGDVLVADADGNVELVDTHAGDTVSILASGGNRSAFLTAGADGYLYVAKADQVDQLQPAAFGPVTRRDLQPERQTPSSPAPASGAGPVVVILLVVVGVVVVLVVCGVLGGLARRRLARREFGEPVPAPRLEVTFDGEPSADAVAGASADALPTIGPAALQEGAAARLLARLRPLPGRSARRSIPEFGVVGAGCRHGVVTDARQAAANRLRAALADPDVLPSATTLRFVVLVLAAVASTASIYAHLSVLAQPQVEATAERCVHSQNATVLTSPATGNADLNCLSATVPTLAWWAAAGVLLLLVGATLVYLVAPWFIRSFTRPALPSLTRDEGRWRISCPWWIPNGRPQRLRALDPGNSTQRALAAALDDLRVCMGVRAQPVWLHAPASPKQDARAFGRPSRPHVLIHGALAAMVQQSSRDEAGFTAIASHELAHLRNGDLRPTYATLAVWRVFLAVVLTPYLVSLAAPGIFSRPLHPRAYRLFAVVPDARITVTCLLLIALVFLSVRAVLRVREAHADATAAVYLGGDAALRATIEKSSPRQHRGGVFRFHPRAKDRLTYLGDPARLAAPGTAALFGLGVAVSLVMVNVLFAVELAAPGWIAVTALLVFGHGNVPLVTHLLLLFGPAALFVATVLTAAGCMIVWRARLVADAAAAARAAGLALPGDDAPQAGFRQRAGRRLMRGGPLMWALAFATGVVAGVPLSAINADAGVWGVFDISVPWEIADTAASAAALTLIAVLLFAWARESSAAWLPHRTAAPVRRSDRTRRSRRAALAAAVAVGVCGALPAVFAWQLSGMSSSITSFSYPRYPAQLDGLFGARWAFVDYYPLNSVSVLPGTGALMAVPSLCLALTAARRARRARSAQQPARRSRSAAPAAAAPSPVTPDSVWGPRKAVTVGLVAAALCEVGGFLVAFCARALVGGQRLSEVLYNGTNGPYLAVEWMSWLTVTICAVAALVTTRSVGAYRLTAALLTCWVATTAASFLLVPPLFTTFCGAHAYSCAVELPHDLFAFYGLLAAQAPVYAVIALVLCLGLLRAAQFASGLLGWRRSAGAPGPDLSPGTGTEPPAASDIRHPGWRRRGRGLLEALVLLAVLANVAGGIYVFYNQLLAFS